MAESTLRNSQYRPVSTAETSTNDALSVRVQRDFALGINNAFSRACAPVFSDAWPGTHLGEGSSDTSENVLLFFPAIWCGPDGHYNFATWSVSSYIGVSSNDATVRLYSSSHRYTGPLTMTDSWKSSMGIKSSSEITSDVAVPNSSVKTSHEELSLNPNDAGETFFLLTSTFAGASGTNSLFVNSLTITLAHVAADIP